MPLLEFDKGVRETMARTCAMVLGGGQGTRLYPLTALRAKPAVPLLGRYRLIDIPLSNCIHSNIRRIFVLTQFNSASLNRHINNSYTFDNFSKGFVEILAAEQTVENRDWFQGTADAVRQHLRHLQDMASDCYLVLSGDQLYRMDYRSFVAAHAAQKADLTVAALPVTEEQAHAFGIMKVRANGRIEKFVEKPGSGSDLDGMAMQEGALRRAGLHGTGRRYLASMGVYVFRAEVLEEVLEKRKDWVDFGKDVVPGLLKACRTFCHVFSGFWEDIGTVRSYYETHMRIVRPDPPFQFYDPNHIIYTHPRYLPGARLHEAVVKDSIICEGSRIVQAEISESVVGIRSVLRAGVHVDRSIIMGADYLEDENDVRQEIPIGIGKRSRISRSIIDKNARIGERVVIQGSPRLADQEGQGWVVRDGIVIVMKNATIPSGTRIG